MDDLEDAIEKRKQEAKSKNIAKKAGFIVTLLGTTKIDREGGEFKTSIYQGTKLFIKNFCRIANDGSAGFSIEIQYKGEIVYLEQGLKISKYIPDVWENTLNRLYRKAKQIGEEKEIEEIHAEQQAKIEKVRKQARENFAL